MSHQNYVAFHLSSHLCPTGPVWMERRRETKRQRDRETALFRTRVRARRAGNNLHIDGNALFAGRLKQGETTARRQTKNPRHMRMQPVTQCTETARSPNYCQACRWGLWKTTLLKHCFPLSAYYLPWYFLLQLLPHLHPPSYLGPAASLSSEVETSALHAHKLVETMPADHSASRQPVALCIPLFRGTLSQSLSPFGS